MKPRSYGLRIAHILLAGVAYTCCCGCVSSSSLPIIVSDSGLVVRTDRGAVQGVTRNGAQEFRGIPYAMAPISELRWTMPQPAAPWEGVKDASHFGSACAQQARYSLTQESLDEDCLSLNISRPTDIKPGEKLPVFFWIHGGAFVGGSSGLYRLDKLANEGRLVVVTANYRLGVFGFMAHPAFDAATNGDLGLEDQRAAMAWVQRNIAAFGGNPDNVTIAGESSGGGSVCMHLLSPERVTGLFHKAIVQSAGCLQPMPTIQESLTGSNALWKKVAAKVGCNTGATAGSAASLACLRGKKVEDLLTAQGEASSGVMSFGPTIGNSTVPRVGTVAAASGNLVKVPLLMGGTRDELRLYTAYAVLFPSAAFPTPIPPFTREAVYSFWLPYFYGSDTTHYNTIYNHYFGMGEGQLGLAISGATVGSMASDRAPVVGINNCLYLNTSNAFARWVPALYQFEFADQNAPVLGVGIAKGMDPGFELGAVHSSELNYLFPKLSNTTAIDGPDLQPASQLLADQMVAFWSAFARTGAPAVAGLPAWPGYAGGATVMLLKPGNVGPYDAATRHQCGFWEKVFP
jgi:para-nitrobenzyl esterase